MVDYKNSPEVYAFSSLAIFIGKRRDFLKLVDYGFIISLFGDSIKSARKNYYDLIFMCNEEKLKMINQSIKMLVISILYCPS